MTGERPARALALDGVTLRRRGTTILDDVSWEVGAGERWVVLGPNGAGKSTLLEIASTYEIASRGGAEVLGHRVGGADLRALRTRIGYAGAPLARRIRPELTVLESVVTGPRALLSTFRQTFTAGERARATELLDELGLLTAAERRVHLLSEGERQRVQLARVLMTDPDLLLLDEPTAGLDVAGREQLLGRLEDLPPAHPVAVVLVTHHLEEIPATATHALLLAGGRVAAAGPIDEVLASPALGPTLGVPLLVHRHGGRWSARRDPQAVRVPAPVAR